MPVPTLALSPGPMRRGLGRAQVPAGVVLVGALGRPRRLGEALELDDHSAGGRPFSS